MSASRQGMSPEEMEQVVAQRVANAIKAIVIYDSKIRMAHNSMNQVVREEATVGKNFSNKRKWESDHGRDSDQQQSKRLKWLEHTLLGQATRRRMLEICLTATSFLGHVVNRDGIHMDPSKVESVKNWKTPESSTEIRSFLGLVGYYRRFIENLSKIAKPLTLLTQKNKTYVWGDKQDESFRIMKEKLCNAPVLALLDGPNDYVVYCDASKQGHVVNRDGIHMDPSKVESVKNWKTPESSTEIHSFLGLVGYYRRFIENLSKIAKPLTLLTQKNKTYVWGDKQDESFRIMKEKLCNAPVLALLDGPNDYVVYCDASKQGFGCVLM
nr:putative reverse transcriptase domain-containing protein [Tanacetum cinerariifolium]